MFRDGTSLEYFYMLKIPAGPFSAKLAQIVDFHAGVYYKIYLDIRLLIHHISVFVTVTVASYMSNA